MQLIHLWTIMLKKETVLLLLLLLLLLTGIGTRIDMVYMIECFKYCDLKIIR